MYIDLRLGTLIDALSGRRIEADEAQALARARADRFHQVGVRRGDRVFLHHGNRAEFFIDLLALWRMGACAVPVDPRFTAFELAQLLRAATPRASVWEHPPAEDLRAALQAAGVACLDPGTDEAARAGGLPEAPLPAGLPALDDDALLLFTSGTTGQPKGVLHTHRSLRTRWNHQRERLGTEDFARTLCTVPTHFAWGLVGHALYTWFSGLTLLLTPAWRQDVLLRLGALCDQHEVTCLPSVPTMWRVALKTVAPPRAGTLRLVTSGTSPLPAALWEGIGRWAGGARVLNIYGITETGWLAGARPLPEGGVNDALVGEPWGAVIRVLDSADPATGPGRARECAPGETGHLWVQTPAMMKGYLGREDLTAQVVSHGWFCTGDLGAFDEAGRLYLRGREKEMINVGGAKIYPRDLDMALEDLPGVEDVAAYAIDDPVQGEAVAVALVLARPDEDALLSVWREASRRLAPYQMPRRWVLADAIPRTARGKLDRRAVAAHCEGLPATEARVLERLAKGAA